LDCTHKNYLLKHVTEGRIEGMRRRGRRGNQLLDDLKKNKNYWNSKEKAVYGTIRRKRFGKDYGTIARQAT
jgi:hypothetical protein